MIGYLRERWAAVIIAMGALYAVFAFWTSPKLEAFDAVRHEQATATRDLAALASPEGGVTRREVALNVARLVEQGFAQEGLLGEQDSIHDLAEEAGVRVDNLDPEDSVDDETFGSLELRSRRVRVSATGSYDAIASFLSLIDRAPMAVVERFSLGEGETRGMMTLSVTIQTGSVDETRSRIADGGTE